MEQVCIGAVRNAIKKFGKEHSFEDLPKSGQKSQPVIPELAGKVRQAFTARKLLLFEISPKSWECLPVQVNVQKQSWAQDLQEAEKAKKKSETRPICETTSPKVI